MKHFFFKEPFLVLKKVTEALFKFNHIVLCYTHVVHLMWVVIAFFLLQFVLIAVCFHWYIIETLPSRYVLIDIVLNYYLEYLEYSVEETPNLPLLELEEEKKAQPAFHRITLLPHWCCTHVPDLETVFFSK